MEEDFYLTPKMEKSFDNIDRIMRETQASMVAMQEAMQASVADLQNRLQSRSRHTSHHSHRSSHGSSHHNSSHRSSYSSSRRTSHHQSRRSSNPEGSEENFDYSHTHPKSHHRHTRFSTDSEELEEQRHRRKSGDRSRTTRCLPLPDKHSPSSSLISSQTETQMKARTVPFSSQSRTSFHISQARTVSRHSQNSSPDLSSCPRKSPIDFHYFPSSSQVVSLCSPVLSQDGFVPEQEILPSIEEIEREPIESGIKKTNKEDEIEEQTTVVGVLKSKTVLPVKQTPDYASPNIEIAMDLTPSRVSIADLLIHPCFFGSRVLTAYEIGALKIKNVSDDKAVRIKSQEPRQPREMFSEYSGIDKRKSGPEAQEDHVDLFLGEFAIMFGNRKPFPEDEKSNHSQHSDRSSLQLTTVIVKDLSGLKEAELQHIVDSMINYHKLGLHNPLKALGGYLKLGDITAKTVLSLSLTDVFDILTRVLQKMALKSYQQALGEVVAPKFLEILYGNQVHFLARSSEVSGSYLGRNRPDLWTYGPLEIVTYFKFVLDIPAFQLMGALLKENMHVLKEDIWLCSVMGQMLLLFHDGGIPLEIVEVLNSKRGTQYDTSFHKLSYDMCVDEILYELFSEKFHSRERMEPERHAMLSMVKSFSSRED